MRILYVHQYFKTPEEGGCVQSYHLAKGLINAGHEVVMISGHDHKKGKHTIDGMEVHYLRIPYKNQFGFIRRIWAFLQFVRLAKRTVNLLTQRFDLAYVMTTPLTTGLIAMHIKQRLNDSIETAPKAGKGTVIVSPSGANKRLPAGLRSGQAGANRSTGEPANDLLFSERYACAACGSQLFRSSNGHRP